MTSDLRMGFRSLGRRPGFSAMVVLTLALGIAAASAVVSVVQSVLLTPPPFDRPERLVLLAPTLLEGREGQTPDWSAEQWYEWREEAESFETISAYRWEFDFLTTEGEGSRSLQGMRVTHDYFETMGLDPVMGRTFEPSETGGAGAPSVILIGYHLWEELGSDPNIVGQSLPLGRNDTPPEIIGVMAPGSRFLPVNGASSEPNYDVHALVDYWLPSDPMGANANPQFYQQTIWGVVGLLREDVPREAAEAEIGALVAQQAVADPSYDGVGVRAEPLLQVMNADAERILEPLVIAAILVLMIACGNAAALLFVRGIQRGREYGVRNAMGASRGSLVRLVGFESMILALLGGGLGVALAWQLVRALQNIGGNAIPRLDSASPGWQLPVIGMAIAVVAALVAGVYPALRATRPGSRGPVEGSTRTTLGRRERRLLAVVTTGQAALTLALLVGAGLLVRTMVNLASVDAGYRTDRILTMSVTAVRGDWADFHQQAMVDVAELPGVEGVAFAWGVPLTGDSWMLTVGTEETIDQPVRLSGRAVTPGYFDLIGQRILEGRDFTSDDDQDVPSLIAIVNEEFARRFFDGRSAVGRTIYMDLMGTRPLEIVGVVSDGRTEDLVRAAEPELYLSLWQVRAYSKTMLLRTAMDASAITTDVQRVLRRIDPTVAVESVRTLEQVRQESVATQRFAMQLLMAFAAVATLLTLGGIYGVLSLGVASRRRELAIRAAVGAGARVVFAFVLRQGARMIALGIGIGLILAVLVSRLMASMLFGVEPTDALTLALAAGSFSVVGLLSCWIPARRAARLDPVNALKED